MTRTKSNDGAKRIAEMKTRFFEDALGFWEKHEKKFLEVINGSEEKQATVTFSASICLSESAPQLETQVRIPLGTFSDKLVASFAALEDPDQLSDPQIMEETAPKKGRRKEP